MSYNTETGLYEGFIYKISNDINNKLYIGQTTQTLKQRMSAHVTQNHNNSMIHYAIAKYGKDHFHIEEISKYSASTKDELVSILNSEEIRYIKDFNSITPYGYNISSGGGQFPTRFMKPVTAYDYYGNMIKEYKSISDAAYDISGDKSSILGCCNGNKKYANGYIWRYKGDDFNKYSVDFSKDEMISGGKRPVDQYTIDGEFMMTYDSIYDAARSLNVDYSSINHCCLGNHKTSHGYIWRYHGDPLDTFSYDGYHLKHKIKQYTKDGELINIFDCLSEAARSIGSNISILNNISSCCKGRKSSCYGSVWRYENDSFEKYPLKFLGFNAKKINQYTKDGIFIKTFNSLKEAGNAFEAKSARDNIYRCCTGKQSTSYGYLWFYANDPDQPDKTKIISDVDYNNADLSA